MKKVGFLLAVSLLLISAALVVAAAGERDRRNSARQRQEDDVRHAEVLWGYVKDYSTWPAPEGFEGWQEGTSPHGRYLRYHVNWAALEDPHQNLAVIVKANYSRPSEDALQSITAMQKREGYDPERNDWFYVIYSPEGEVMRDRRGRRVAGRTGPARRDCISCHAGAPGGDYLFMTD